MLDVEASRIKGSDTVGAPADYYPLVIPNRNRTNLLLYKIIHLMLHFLEFFFPFSNRVLL